MPEIHKTPVNPATETTTAQVAAAILDKGVSSEALDAQIEKLLDERKKKHEQAALPKEPDWSKLSEQDAYKKDVYIPVIEHDIPDYMNIKLADESYMPVWVSRDQRQLGAKQAEGYELIKPEMLAKDFKAPLKFDSEGLYIYADVIAMRVHKRLLFGKRRRSLEISQRQLKNTNRTPKQRIKGTYDLSNDEPLLEPGLEIYETH